MAIKPPTIGAVKKNRKRIAPWILKTPVWQAHTITIQQKIPDTEVFYKLELFQQAGSFKARGAITSLLNMDESERAKGVVAATAGNHGIAVSYAANVFGVSAKIVMPKTASPVRVQRCKEFGAEVILVDSVLDAFNKMEEIAEQEKRTVIHPFEGPLIALGTGTIGLELIEQIKKIDAVVIPIGGGGLCGGIAAFIKQALPQCQIYGVEPEGADVMYRSFVAGKPVALETVNTIADSLGAPKAFPYSFSLCHQFVDEIVRINDKAIATAEKFLFDEMKLAVEPAAAASTAALLGPLAEPLRGKKVVLIVSGTNIDSDRFHQMLKLAG
jgi:threonine dehydratase